MLGAKSRKATRTGGLPAQSLHGDISGNETTPNSDSFKQWHIGEETRDTGCGSSMTSFGLQCTDASYSVRFKRIAKLMLNLM